MISSIFHSLIFVPLYNALVGLLWIVPFGDVGVAVIVLTVLVKLLLFPLSMKSVKTQMIMREIEGSLKEIREKYKDDKQKQALETMALYKEKGINPFSSILLLFIQLPIIFGLYWVFYKGGLPVFNTAWLYPFVHAPEHISMMFLGLIDMGKRNLLLAILAGITQYIQARLTLPKLTPRSETATLQEDLARSMSLQMRFILPITITFIAYYIVSAVALYWVTSNIFAIGQELYMRRVRARSAS